MKKGNQDGHKKRSIFKLLGGGIVLIALAGGGYFVYHTTQERTQTESAIREAEKLVLYNPLAKGENAEKLRKLLPKSGEQTTMKLLVKHLKTEDLKGLITKTKSEIKTENGKIQTEQENKLKELTKKIEGLKKDQYFPKEKTEAIDKLIETANAYQQAKDIVGLNVCVAGLQSLVGETTTYIQEKTAEQKEREEKEKAAKEKAAKEKKEAEEKAKKEKEAEEKVLETQIKNETYPSLGILRGDMADGGGVIPMYLISGGPADNADFQTDAIWDNSSVIVAIDGKEVQSAVIGDHSMNSVLQTFKLGKKVEVEFKDGSTKDVVLDLTQKEAATNVYPELKDFGDDSETDLYFGVSGYNMGEHNDNKEIGLKITDIYSDGSAADSDLEKGDIICRIDGYYIGDATDIPKVMSHYSDGDIVDVDIIDGNNDLKTVSVTLKEK